MHHTLDIYPIPSEKQPLYINEPWLVDRCMAKSVESIEERRTPNGAKDNIRIFVPIDLNKEAISDRLHEIIARYGEATEDNESEYSLEVDLLFQQVEIYDQVWFVREKETKNGKHSAKGIELVKEFVKRLREIPEGDSECFPYELIDQLEAEWCKN